MSEVKLSQFDCGSCPNITDGCFGKCEKSKPEVIRMFVNWNMQEYFQHKDGDVVWFTDFDAQRLRADTAEAERDSWKDMREQSRLRNAKLRKKLAAAEQRIAELLIMLRQAWIDECVSAVDCRKIDAALNPNPEAESQSDYLESCKAAERALSLESQRITPARFKCLACGAYHEGSSNFPCPKMTPYSGNKP